MRWLRRGRGKRLRRAAGPCSSPQRPERRPDLRRQGLRLLPGCDMAALVHLVVVDELGVGAFGPAQRGRIQLVREDRDADRYLDALGVEEGQLALPVEPG